MFTSEPSSIYETHEGAFGSIETIEEQRPAVVFLGNKKQKKKAEPGENETFKKEIERLRFDWTDVSCRRSEKYKKNAFDSFVCFHLEFVNNGKAKEKGMANRKQQ